jgi:hypothetical protein
MEFDICSYQSDIVKGGEISKESNEEFEGPKKTGSICA